MKYSRTILENLSKGIISFMDHNPHPIWMVDSQHNIIYANQAMLNYVGPDSQSVTGGKLAAMFSPDLASTLEEKINRVFSRKLPDHSTVRSTMPDGTQRYFQLTLFPIQEILAFPMVGCAALDITDPITKARQEERELIGHELHDNVNQILTTANLYLRLPEEDYYRSEDIRSKISELTETAIEEIRRLSRGLVTPHFNELGLIGHITRLVNDIRHATPCAIQFTHDNRPDIELLEKDRKLALLRILQEQLKNIIRHAHATHVRISLHCPGSQVRLSIIDDGCGFDAKTTPHGLGLSHIYERARLYKGEVTLETAPGKGCLLTVEMPTAV
ncbi:MAG TPA: ATP-binding protein [Puia sp.]|jgi:PAS domain S-box-containing protein|nr:ATP-binding protein [Puia sp.]